MRNTSVIRNLILFSMCKMTGQAKRLLDKLHARERNVPNVQQDVSLLPASPATKWEPRGIL